MAIPRNRSTNLWPLFSAGFRPFFLAAGLWACFSMVTWVFMLRGDIELPTNFDPVAWHFHELLFGFVAAAIVGFLLTAIPNWTGRLPLQGWPLGFLVLLWFSGRIAVAFSAWTGSAVAMMVDVSFLVTFAGFVGREIIAARNWRNLPLLVAVALLVAANLMLHMSAFGYAEWHSAGKRLTISIIVMLISLIGGRILPSFTTNWLRHHAVKGLPTPFGQFDKATLTISVMALATWVIVGLTTLSGVTLILAGAMHAVRLARWRGGAALREPLVWILHLGYAWLPIGLVLLGSAVWMPSLGPIAIHALTVGAMGTMIVAVMTRASLGHTKRELTAGPGTIAIYILVLLAAGARVAGPIIETTYALDLAGGAWIAAFAIFVACYLPLYIRR